MPARVLKSYTTQYPDPIAFGKGEVVALGKRDTEFPGWIWATSEVTGKSGWVPEHFLAIEGDRGISLRDYSAKELRVTEGEIVTVLEELLEWALVQNEHGARGWVPLKHLARSVSPTDLPF
jgi:hypothetical protein